MRKASAEKDEQKTYDERRNERQSRHRCGTGRARRAGEDLPEEGRDPEEGSTQGPENREGWADQGRRTEEGSEGGQVHRPLQEGQRPARREQGREDPGDDRT